MRLLESDAKIDLLITDVGLPGGMNGWQLADVARELQPDLKVLFLTGFAENKGLGNGVLGHSMQVMTKPFSLEAFALRIRELLAR
jgi:DNA-binding response OmpR family regulator